jgi:transcriptional regulator with XRE-family HTH domain
VPPGDASREEAGRAAQMAFGRALRTLRQRRRLSQERLAFQAGLHPSYVAQVERGERNISLRNIWQLADALGVEPAELLLRSS